MIEDLIKLIIAALLGGLVGIERESRGQYAGFRTQILVSLGACLFTIVSVQLHLRYGTDSDPGRIAAQIVTGIGFLGAGAILRQGELIRGLTTAATLWVVSAIGMAVGFGKYPLAGMTTLVVLASLILLRNVEEAFIQSRFARLKIVLRGFEELELRKSAEPRGIRILDTKFRYWKDKGFMEQDITLVYRHRTRLLEFSRELKDHPRLMELHIY